ncbi:MAG TPA: fumarylacetoacetate hydrolase family protein [Acidobacteriaceae bacterium]|jgi:2-keto-4-pentenoate hydratase/2-oxohepta-3-ene-1,7-dioic acid hydratase in catechol pathway|nr:fumarylacetoacetate hydrolase family protein [Acidobacteriaceae bacterium]
MKFVSFKDKQGAVRGGVLEGSTIRPLARSGSDDVLAHIASGSSAPSFEGETIPVDQVSLLAPIQQPPRVFGIGLNYRAHAEESKMALPSSPVVFIKLSSSVVGPDTDVILAPNATDPDYEAELGVVIGRPGHYIKAADWEQHVFGYTIVNDISARGIQRSSTQWNLAKSFPTFTPMGPVIVTRDEIADPHELDIRLTLSGEVMQSAKTNDLIFRIPELIEYLSSMVPLLPGDVISTGTPSGVGMGRTPPRWLRPGDEMVVDIQGIGSLRNRTRSA